MKLRKMLLMGVTIGFAFILVMGCSRTNPLNSSENEATALESAPANTITPYQYPPEASVPPPGYRFVALVDPQQSVDNLWSWTYMYKAFGGWCYLQSSYVHIWANGLPYNSWIGMSKETYNTPWIDYEPHGLVFNFTQQGKLSYANCTLPPGIEPEDLTIWYWHEDTNTYEYIGGTNYVQYQYILFPLNHFSRYVVAAADSTEY